MSAWILPQILVRRPSATHIVDEVHRDSGSPGDQFIVAAESADRRFRGSGFVSLLDRQDRENFGACRGGGDGGDGAGGKRWDVSTESIQDWAGLRAHAST